MKTKSSQFGFTLIEVLVALMILGIALVAIIKVTGDSARNVERIKDISVAHWIGMDTISSMQVGLIPKPTTATPEEITTKPMLKQIWYLTISAEKTPNKDVEKIKLTVKKTKKSTPTATLYSFVRTSNDEAK